MRWLLLIVWAGVILTAMLFYGLRQLTWFDPEMRLSQAASQVDFDRDFVALLHHAGVKNHSLIHLQDTQGCYCNKLSLAHQQLLQHSLLDEGYTLTTLNINKHPDIAAVMPSFPALAVIDELGQLRYLGPYSTGYGCFTGDDLVDDITQLIEAPYYGATINTEAVGCYCQRD
jgi:hypothetical protein